MNGAALEYISLTLTPLLLARKTGEEDHAKHGGGGGNGLTPEFAGPSRIGVA